MRKVLIAFAIAFVAALGPLAALAIGDGGPTNPVATTATTTTGGLTLTVGTSTVNIGGPTTTVTGPSTGTTTVPAPAPGPTTGTSTFPAPAPPPAPTNKPNNVFSQRGMWVWEMAATAGGNVNNLIAQAKKYKLGTLYIKAGDGTGYWSQFSHALVARLHKAGIHACAWQFVYGNSPGVEAQVGETAVKKGADCLVIDAEDQYGGKYAQASTYMGDLRKAVGSKYPIALTSFPYVDKHVGFPYSVFMGHGGAQYNMPQMYWRAIGTTPDTVYSHTFAFNQLYRRPILPLGQVYEAPPVAQIKRFRALGLSYHASDYSWWDWQEAKPAQFGAVASPVGPIAHFSPSLSVASLGPGAIGDPVRWAQEHLYYTHERIAISGSYNAATSNAVKRFQGANKLPVSGVITPQTWNVLLKQKVPDVHWVMKGKNLVATVKQS
ncbi:MAG: peptidoglycan-binding protein [Solirubrobacterales bacterium]|nr:peptidoglycan-binding protein [Solirubrobacterales bacterium]